jgi:hypothetical protein
VEDAAHVGVVHGAGHLRHQPRGAARVGGSLYKKETGGGPCALVPEAKIFSGRVVLAGLVGP